MSIPSVATAAVLRGAMGVLLAPDFLSTKHTAVEGGSAAGPSHMRHCGAGLISWPEWRRGGLREGLTHWLRRQSSVPRRPGEFHPDPLTEPYLSLSTYTARAPARRLPPSVEQWAHPVAG